MVSGGSGFSPLLLFWRLPSKGHSCLYSLLIRQRWYLTTLSHFTLCWWDREHTHTLGLQVCYSFYFLQGFLTHLSMCAQICVDGLDSHWFLVYIKHPINLGYLESLSLNCLTSQTSLLKPSLVSSSTVCPEQDSNLKLAELLALLVSLATKIITFNLQHSKSSKPLPEE